MTYWHAIIFADKLFIQFNDNWDCLMHHEHDMTSAHHDLF